MMMQMVGSFAEIRKGDAAGTNEGGFGFCSPGRAHRWPSAELTPQQQSEIRKMVSKGRKTAADAARLFKVHPATVSRLLARPPASPLMKAKHAK
jgi:DNA invertase Pin-like site-specific DNA recombinase